MNGIKILIVDDEPELAEIVADQVDMMGYETSTFTDSVQAQEFLKSNLVDLIISDIRMPNLAGNELYKWAKENLNQVPKIIFISGFSEYDKEDMLAMGAVDLIAKPFTFAVLENTIQLALDAK
ncbi:MAG: response regulator [Bdellovibrionota bacterium]|nr:hypothetical protein [Pseudobdellovibrionaceae bacterium]|tara:strand:+ start:14901 stop:15269 length:369 start_codon:yes stop_codon:yes gene_type:complete